MYMHTVLCKSYVAAGVSGCVSCVLQLETGYGFTWEDSCCVYELIDWDGFTGFLLCNQYITFIQCLHIYCFPTVHICPFMTCLYLL